MAKPIPIQGKDGRLAGSIGVGRDNVPSASEVVIPPLAVVRETDPDYSSYTSIRAAAEKLLKGYVPDAEGVLADPQSAVDYAFAVEEGSRKLRVEDMIEHDHAPSLASGWSYGSTYGKDGVEILRHDTLADDYSIHFMWDSGKETTVLDLRTDDDSRSARIHVDEGRRPHSPSKHGAAVTVAGVGSAFYRHGVVHRPFDDGPAVEREDGTSSWVEDGKVYVTVNPDGSVVDGEGKPVKGLSLRWKAMRAYGLSAAIARRHGTLDSGW